MLHRYALNTAFEFVVQKIERVLIARLGGNPEALEEAIGNLRASITEYNDLVADAIEAERSVITAPTEPIA